MGQPQPWCREVLRRDREVLGLDHLARTMARLPPGRRQEIERQTLDYMATMPAWRDHPRVRRSGV